MRGNSWNTPLVAGLLVSGIVGCDAVNKLKDALDGDPQISYCESLCDWGVECADGHSSLDLATMTERCDEATYASDSVCEKADAGTLSVDESLALTECTDAVAEMDCGAITGDETDVLTGIPPVICAAYSADVGLINTYNAARNAVMQTGDELCDEVVDNICSNMVECLLGDHGDALGEEVGDDAETYLMNQCTDTAFGAFVTECKASGLYDQELPVDVNPNRFLVDMCIEGFGEDDVNACNPVTWPLSCTGAFTPLDGENLWDLVADGAAGFLGSYID
jgi:hypothetical protein